MYLHYNPHFQVIMLRLLFPLRLGEYYKIIAKCHRSNRYLELDDTSIYGINVFHNTISLYIAVPKNHSMMSYTNYSAPNKFSKLIYKTQIAHFVMGDKGHSD